MQPRHLFAYLAAGLLTHGSSLVHSFPPLRSPPASHHAEADSGGLLHLSLYLPGACLVVAVPPAADPASAPSSAAELIKPKYFALEVQGSSSQLVASMGPRMGSQHAQVSERVWHAQPAGCVAGRAGHRSMQVVWLPDVLRGRCSARVPALHLPPYVAGPCVQPA